MTSMNKLFTLIFILSAHFLLAQQQNVEEFQHELFVKITPTSFRAINNTSVVNVASELAFLPVQVISKMGKTSRPFYRSKVLGLNRVYAIKIDKNADIAEVISQLKSDPSVEYVEQKRIRQIIGTPNDPSAGLQWHLNKVEAFAAWDITIPSGTIKVAVIDNAVQTTHPDLTANMLPGYDASDLDNDPNPPNNSFSHGTHVAGIAGAVTNNNLGIASAGNNRVKIMPIKATPNNGDPRGIYTGYEGVQWAIDNNADVISLSWGGGGYSQTEQDVINAAYAQGIVVIAAAGNDNNDLPHYPAAYEHVISVASLDDNDSKSSFSTFGTTIDISAPGRGILSTIPTNQYDSFGGTSMATPLVSAIVGYLLSGFPTLTPDEVEALIKRTADDISAQNAAFTGKLGAGRVNMYKLISCKNSSLDNVSIMAVGSPLFCAGDSVVVKLNTIVPTTATFQWYNNNQLISGATVDSIIVRTAGEYRLRVIDGSCEINSNTQQINLNSIYTQSPEVNYLEAFYCSTLSSSEKLVATASNCNFSGPSQFSYAGPVIGFDGNGKSGVFPTANVTGLAGLLSSITVSVTWDKKDVFSFNSCGDIDAGGQPFNDEVEFKLISPGGKEVVLIAIDTYASGATSSGTVTTVFSMNGTPIINGSLPSSGTFLPAQSFDILIGELANGTWTLYANDNAFVDPLCVSAFNVTITTNAQSGSPQITWYDSPLGGNLIHTGTDFVPPTLQVGGNDVFVQAKCDGACPSTRVKASYFIKNVPYIVAFPLNYLYPNAAEANQIKNEEVSFTLSDSTFSINRPGVNGGTYSDTFSYDSPLESPLTVCKQSCYVVVATGCPSGAVTWGGGTKGEGDIICLGGAYTVTAVCEEPMSCPPIGSNVFEFKNPDENLLLTRRIAENANQAYDSQTISSNQFVETPSQTDYRATKNIVLTPGFSVSGNSTFSAIIGGCPN